MATQRPRLEVDPQALEAIDLAIVQAKRLKQAPSRAPEVWLCCLELARVEVAAGRAPRVPAHVVATSLKFRWHVSYFHRCKDWHAKVVERELRRLAAREDLFPLGIDYARGGRLHHIEPELILIRLPRSRSTDRTARASGHPPAAPAPPGTSQWANTEPRPSPDEGARVIEPTSASTDETDEYLREERFIARFGFDAPPLVREQVLRLKRANQWTDRTIRYLKRTGALTVRGNNVECRPNRWMLAAGALFLCMMVLPLLHAVLAFYLMPARDLWGTTKVLAVIFSYLAICWGIYYVYIRPFVFLLHTPRNRQPESSSELHADG